MRPNPHYRPILLALIALYALLAIVPTTVRAQDARPRVGWHWHNHQPIYWNDQRRAGPPDRYEYAWESIQQKDGGSGSPENNLREIFGKDDRVAAYQFRTRDAVNSVRFNHPNGGASESFSGALIENINSLGQANQLGYGPGWAGGKNEANEWDTTLGNPRLDLVNFSFHHGLLALLPEETVRMELLTHQEKVKQTYGADALSRGTFPTEMAFSTRLIPIYEELGIEWAIVSGEKIARACPDFPVVFGSGGVNCDPPNPADQINPLGVDFIRTTISRGCSPVNANPLSYQPAWAKYVDAETGVESRMIVVPADQGWGWNDGFQCIGAGFLDPITPKSVGGRPSLVLLVHDGDNAFGGGFSYYNECVPGLASDTVNRGGVMSTVEDYLEEFPVPNDALVHVEDGAWVNADSDFGSPSFINWNYPLITNSGQIDPVNGWHEKARDMAIFVETLNRVLTAQQISGRTPDLAQIVTPGASTHPVDRAWHYHLGSLDSGNVYFGPALDLEIKATIGANEAFEHADPVIGDGTGDTTPPTIWLPQRHPYNPGSVNFGVQYGYQQFVDDGDFHIWTFISDVSEPVTATLYYRIDNDGTNPLSSNQNETYEGGSEVGDWVPLAMNRRDFPKGLPAGYDRPTINLFELPEHIADHFSVEVTGLREVLIDYYVEATDNRGNTAKSVIQHVWIGDGEGATGGGGDVVMVSPNPPVRGKEVTITYDASSRNLNGSDPVYIHYGRNNWDFVFPTDPAMTLLGEEKWSYTYTIDPSATQIDMVFNNHQGIGNGIWDNNDGQDWHFPTVEPATETNYSSRVHIK